MNNWFRSGIFRRILLSILAVSLVPLIILGLLTLFSTNEAGIAAIDRSREALDAKSAGALKLRAMETAQAIANFLNEREAAHDKFAAYAPIPYYGGSYVPPAGFGWVGNAANVVTFHEAATLMGDALQSELQTLITGAAAMLVITAPAVVVIAGLLARYNARAARDEGGHVL